MWIVGALNSDEHGKSRIPSSTTSLARLNSLAKLHLSKQS